VSTIDAFFNRDLRMNLRETGEHMRIKCNAGTTISTQMGYLPGYGPVWYKPSGISNILSLARVGENYKVAYDNR
jgi:hypothetical protein